MVVFDDDQYYIYADIFGSILYRYADVIRGLIFPRYLQRSHTEKVYQKGENFKIYEKKGQKFLKNRKSYFSSPTYQGFHCPGTFPIFKSRDFWTCLVPGPGDHGTFKVSRSCPVLSRDLGPLVPGLPRTFRDLFGKLFEKKKSIQKYMFFYFGKFFYWQNY